MVARNAVDTETKAGIIKKDMVTMVEVGIVMEVNSVQVMEDTEAMETMMDAI